MAEQDEAKQLNGNPDWANAPAWAIWLAQDLDGSWWWYEDMPETLSVGWCCTKTFQGNNLRATRSRPRNENWKETLERRPSKQESK